MSEPSMRERMRSAILAEIHRHRDAGDLYTYYESEDQTGIDGHLRLDVLADAVLAEMERGLSPEMESACWQTGTGGHSMAQAAFMAQIRAARLSPSPPDRQHDQDDSEHPEQPRLGSDDRA